MIDDWPHVEVGAGGPVLRRTGLPLAEVLHRLEVSSSLATVQETFQLLPAELIDVLAFTALGTDGPDALGLVQAEPRRPWIAEALTEASWAPLLPRAPRPARLALAAGLLQIHDFWDASHEAAQQAGDLGERSVSAFWHGVAHRREPDPGNAAYWFRRVGGSPIFSVLGEAAAPLLEEYGDPALTARLSPDGAWKPLAFIDFCQQGRAGSAAAGLASRLQRFELIALFRSTAAAVLVPG